MADYLLILRIDECLIPKKSNSINGLIEIFLNDADINSLSHPSCAYIIQSLTVLTSSVQQFTSNLSIKAEDMLLGKTCRFVRFEFFLLLYCLQDSILSMALRVF